LSTVHSQPPSGDAVGALFRFASRYKGLMAALVLLGVLLGYGWSSRQPVRYEGVVRFFVEAGSDQSDVDKIVRRQAEVLISPVVLDRTVGLSGDRLTRRLETLRDNATVRRDPAQPKPLQSAVIGGLLGLLVSAVLVWWRTRRHGPPPRSSAPELPSPA
jgi:uncharacterized protein involved in exopolysaccharide biosynthesis